MLSLNAAERGLVLPQLPVPDFDDFESSPYMLGEVNGGMDWGGGLGVGEGVGGWIECKLKFQKINKNKRKRK